MNKLTEVLKHKVDYENFQEEIDTLLMGMSERGAGNPNPIKGSRATPFENKAGMRLNDKK